MGLQKSTGILNMKAFLDERIGPAAWDELIASLPDADRSVLRSLVPGDWYDYALHGRLNRAFCDVFYNGDLSAAEALGRYSAVRNLSLAYIWKLWVAQPELAIQHANSYWRQEESSGTLTAEHQSGEFIVRISEWEGCHEVLCRRLLGYVGRLLEVHGEVVQAKHTRCAARGDSVCVFHFHWHGPQRAHYVEPSPSRPELVDFVKQLELLRDLPTRANAITSLLLGHLSFTYVELWVQSGDSDELMLLRCVGSSSGAPRRCILLPRGERVVGRIEGEALPGAPDDLLEQLAPHLASALDGGPLRGRPLTHEQAIARRLEVARTKYGVTDRELEALALVAEGCTNETIAEKLGISRRTVETYISRLQARLMTTGRRDLCSFFWSKL